MPLPSMGGIVFWRYDLTRYDVRYVNKSVFCQRSGLLFIKQIHGAVYTLQAEGCDDVLCHGDTFG